jgi:hypothetical protein
MQRGTHPALAPVPLRRKLMKPIVWMGALLALLGILGLAAPVFTTSQTRDVVNLGDLKIQSTEHSTHVVPEALSAAALVLGVLLLGAGLYQRR